MSRRWSIILVAALVVLDLVVLAVGYRTRSGALPPWQVEDPSFPTSPTGTQDATTGAGGGISAPLLLAVNADGVVLRATRGACQPQYHKTVEVGVGTIGTDAEPKAVAVEGLAEVLGLMVYPDDSMRIAGLDSGCDPVSYSSSDLGRTWQSSAGSGPGIWALDPDTTQPSMTGPFGRSVHMDCTPDQVVNLPDRKALAMCASTTFYQLAQGKAPAPIQANGFSQLSAVPARESGHFYVFGTTSCGARVGEVVADVQAVNQLNCFGKDVAPLAIGVSGDRIVVQVGDQMQVSTDGGQTFGPMA